MSESSDVTRVLDLVKMERIRQDQKWGEQNHDDYRWLAILSEEVGELAQSILHDEFGGKAAGTARAELIQVAAVAIQWLECMERRGTAVKYLCPHCGDDRTDKGSLIVNGRAFCNEEHYEAWKTAVNQPSGDDRSQTPAYVARCKCGCGGVVMATVDVPEHAEDTALSVAECIREGHYIERVTVGYVRSFFEENHLGCLVETAVTAVSQNERNP